MSTNIIAVAAPADATNLVNNNIPDDGSGPGANATDSDSTQVVTFSVSGNPPGTNINPSTGVLYGTPTQAGDFTVTITATDPTGSYNSDHFTWTIAEPPPIVINMDF